ncbi:MAG: T9SS type A sorting domain-containing protein, partial [Bacteroidota bacterium]
MQLLVGTCIIELLKIKIEHMMRLIIASLCSLYSIVLLAQEEIITWDNGNFKVLHELTTETEYEYKFNQGANKVKVLAKRGALRKGNTSKIYFQTQLNQTGQQLLKVNMIDEHGHVSFALSDFAYSYVDNGDANHLHKLQLEGLKADGSIVYPVFAKNEFLNDQFYIVDEGKFEFTGGTSHDCIVQFNEPIKNIKVKVLGAPTNDDAYLSFSMGDIAYNDFPEDDNLPMAPIDCNDIKMLVILDASKSIESDQHTAIEQKLYTNFRRLKNRTDITVQAAFVEFDNGANLTLDYTEVTDANTANAGPIGNYLKNIYNTHQNGDTQVGELTNWESGFRKSWNQLTEIPDLVVFITDGLPNWSNSATLYPRNNQSVLQLVKQFKQSGSHILSIGLDMIEEDQANPWLNKITNAINPTWANSTSLDDYNDLSVLDYINLNSIDDLPDNFFKQKLLCTAPGARTVVPESNSLPMNNTSTAMNQQAVPAQALQQIEQQEKVEALTLFPNPTSSILNIALPLEILKQDFEIKLMDVNGKLIQTEFKFSGHVFEINTSA